MIIIQLCIFIEILELYASNELTLWYGNYREQVGGGDTTDRGTRESLLGR